MDPARTNQLAQGRVWSGVDAQRLGLVDKLGDLKGAIASAAKRAGVTSSYQKVSIEPKIGFADFLAENLLGEISVWFDDSLISMVATLPGAKTWFDGIRGLELFAHFNDPRQIYAYSELPF